MKYFLPALLCALVIMSPAAPVTASGLVAAAYGSAQADVPLVVIRFNQRKVYFERQLYTAISKAVAIKPDVLLELVSFVPQGASDQQSQNLAAKSEQNLSSVIQSLQKMGVPRERINVVKEPSDAIRFQEVHIYVE